VHQRTPTRTRHLREFPNALRYNSPDCPVYTGHVRCPTKSGLRNSPASGNRSGCSAIIHRTCPVYTGLSGATTEQQLLRANGHLQAHSMRARSTQKSGTPILAHRTLNSTCPVCTGHPGGPRSQNSNGRNPTGLVTWLAHRTCLVCTGLSGAPYDRQPPPTVMFGGWGYKYPTTPPFMVSKFSTSQLLTRALAFNSRHTKEIKSSPNSTQCPSD
jgi:hypothetical protein